MFGYVMTFAVGMFVGASIGWARGYVGGRRNGIAVVTKQVRATIGVNPDGTPKSMRYRGPDFKVPVGPRTPAQ